MFHMQPTTLPSVPSLQPFTSARPFTSVPFFTSAPSFPSFLRKRESIRLDPRLRGNDEAPIHSRELF